MLAWVINVRHFSKWWSFTQDHDQSAQMLTCYPQFGTKSVYPFFIAPQQLQTSLHFPAFLLKSLCFISSCISLFFLLNFSAFLLAFLCFSSCISLLFFLHFSAFLLAFLWSFLTPSVHFKLYLLNWCQTEFVTILTFSTGWPWSPHWSDKGLCRWVGVRLRISYM